MMDETIDLRSCPFCGSDVAIVGEGLHIEVWCDGCVSQFRFAYLKREEVASAWNRRHTDAAPGEAEVVSFAQSAIEEVSDSWMYRATLHAQWACFYCNVVVEWVGDDGDEAVCEHFPGCLHLRARALRDSE